MNLDSRLILSVKNVSKSFPGVKALDGVTFELEKAGFQREAHFHQNVLFARDESGQPLWQDTYVYAIVHA